ncbi:LPS O-antigen length regulator [Vibrio parahaemolyticus]|nr:LPS O-antigen length regulator [Vibrio parahaemolyticus]
MEPQKDHLKNYVSYPQQMVDENIDLRELLGALWKGKWVIIVMMLVFTVSGAFYAFNLPDIYKSDVLLSPTENSNGGGLSKIAGQLGGLAALAGVNLGGGESSQTDLAVQVMKSRDFIGKFIDEHNLLVPLVAAKGWDMTNNKLIFDEELYNPATAKWLRKAKGLRGITPTSQEAYQIFIKESFSINQDKDSGLYTVSIKHYSPYIAQQWVNWLVEDINKVMRERTIKETSQNLTYLNTQLQKTAVADMQSTFYKLIEDQTKSLMLAEVQEEFIFKVVDPAIVPELKVGPKRTLICLLSVVLGGVLGAVVVVVRLAFRKENDESSELC